MDRGTEPARKRGLQVRLPTTRAPHLRRGPCNAAGSRAFRTAACTDLVPPCSCRQWAVHAFRNSHGNLRALSSQMGSSSCRSSDPAFSSVRPTDTARSFRMARCTYGCRRTSGVTHHARGRLTRKSFCTGRVPRSSSDACIRQCPRSSNRVRHLSCPIRRPARIRRPDTCTRIDASLHTDGARAAPCDCLTPPPSSPDPTRGNGPCARISDDSQAHCTVRDSRLRGR
mmetsp:Transcript_39781/g.93566  ORF Transcript_39781/g.93566 Transcript_39781/m.93566 type:complete len:227 (-) Transcript_39781:1342-2022(-)